MAADTYLHCFCNQVGRCLDNCPTADYYRPTQGERVGTWNLFRRDGTTTPEVPFDLLPEAIKGYLMRGRPCGTH